jgi:hypothetical protein
MEPYMQCCGSALVSMRIRIQLFYLNAEPNRTQIREAKLIRIQADPDPDPDRNSESEKF